MRSFIVVFLSLLLPCVSAAKKPSGAYYYGPMIGKTTEPGNFVAIRGEKASWYARSVMDKDLKKVEELVLSYGQSSNFALQDAVVYLYDLAQGKTVLEGLRYNFKEDQARIRLDEKSETRPSPYQWLWFEAKGHSGLILIERMPRSVAILSRQQRILELYKKMGAVSYDEKNKEVEFVGKYRRIENQAIIEIRIIPRLSKSKSLDKAVFTDILKTVTRYVRTMSTEHVAPVGFFTEKDKDRPSLIFSYTTPPEQRAVYLAVGFTEENAKEFHDYFPYEEPRDSGIRSVYFKKLSEALKLDFDKGLASLLLR